MIKRKRKKKNSLNTYGIHVLGYRCTFFLRFSPSVFHVNVQPDEAFISWTLALWVVGQITIPTAAEN